jgi:hypothetical protein
MIINILYLFLLTSARLLGETWMRSTLLYWLEHKGELGGLHQITPPIFEGGSCQSPPNTLSSESRLAFSSRQLDEYEMI